MNRPLALLALLAAPAFAQPNPQDVPDIPRPADIAERMKKILAEAPEETLEIAGVARLTYKRVWLDQHLLAMKLGGTLTGKEQPRGIPLDRYVKQFEPQCQQALEAHLSDLAALETLVPLTLKKRPLPPGKYRLGVAWQNGGPAAVTVKGEDWNKGKPLVLKLKKHKVEEAPEEESKLRLRFVQPEPQVEGQEKFDVLVRAVGADVATSGAFVRAAEKGGDKGGGEKEKEDEEEDKKE